MYCKTTENYFTTLLQVFCTAVFYRAGYVCSKYLKQYKMKSILLSAFVFFISVTATAQEMGNVNYGSNRYQAQQQNTNTVTTDNGDEITFSIRGIYNEKPAFCAATFSIMQVGESLEEIDALMNEKIKGIKNAIKTIDPTVEVITDMISFVPVYEYEVTKKIFSKKTYTEKPAGYEMKKNLIIKYKGTVLDKIISACAAQEVYDFVKVDYIITSLDAVKARLEAKTLEEFNNKIKYYSLLKGEDLTQKAKNITENYNLVYPVESYSRYTAFSRMQLPFTRNSTVNQVAKAETSYYNPVMVKSHTYVINPEIVEPCVQVFYDLIVTVKVKKEEPVKPAPVENTIERKIFIVTHDGEVKQLDI